MIRTRAAVTWFVTAAALAMTIWANYVVDPNATPGERLWHTWPAFLAAGMTLVGHIAQHTGQDLAKFDRAGIWILIAVGFVISFSQQRELGLSYLDVEPLPGVLRFADGELEATLWPILADGAVIVGMRRLLAGATTPRQRDHPRRRVATPPAPAATPALDRPATPAIEAATADPTPTPRPAKARQPRRTTGGPSQVQLAIDYLTANPGATNGEVAAGAGVSDRSVTRARSAIKEQQ